MAEYTPQQSTMNILETNEWLSIGEVAERLGVKPNTTLRCILDTLAYAGLVLRSWGMTDNNQHAFFYRLPEYQYTEDYPADE